MPCVRRRALRDEENPLWQTVPVEDTNVNAPMRVVFEKRA